MNNGPYGPRATIVKVGACEQLDGETWFVSGWVFHGRHDPRLAPGGCHFTHDEAGHHVGWLGWTFEELKAFSEAEFELAGLETTVPPP